MLKKLLCIACAAALALGTMSLFVGCGGRQVEYDPDNFIADPDSEQIVKEKITINMFTMKASIQGQWEDMYLFQELERRTNIHVEFEEVGLEDVAQMKGLKWEDTENPTDAFFLGNQPYEIAQYSQLGALRELTGYDEYTGNTEQNLLELYAPNYSHWMEEYPEIERVTTQADGKIYAFARVALNAEGGEVATQYINKQWIENLNLASFGDTYVGESGLPETTEQFYNTLKAFKDYDANGNGNASDEVPIIAAMNDASLHFLSSAFGFVGTGIEIDNRETVLDDSGNEIPNPNYNKIVWVPSTQEYREYVQYLNKLYTEGLMHDGLFTNNDTNLNSLGIQGKLGSFTSSGAYFVVGQERDDEYVALPPLVSEHNGTQMAWEYAPRFDPSALIIPKTTPYYREIIRWMDQLYALENESLQYRGEKDVHWREIDDMEPTYDPIRGEDLKRWELIVPEGMDEIAFQATLTYQAGLGNAVFTTVDYDNSGDPYRMKMIEERQTYYPYLKRHLPQISHTAQELEEISALEDSINTYMKNNYGRFINGEQDPFNDATWEEFLNNMARFDYQSITQKYAVAYNRAFPDAPCANELQ